MSTIALLAVLQVAIFVALARRGVSVRSARRERVDPAPDHDEGADGRWSALAEAERTARLGSFALELTTGEVECSEELRRLLDVGAGNLVTTSKGLLATVHPDDRDAVRRAWHEATGLPEPVTVEHRIVRRDGSIRWVDGRVRAVSGDAAEPDRLIGTMQDVSDRRAVESALAHQALHDSLTGLPNRASFLGRLERVMAQRQLRPCGLAVYFLDIDRFKWLNDSRGHAAGDELLVKVGRRLRRTMRPGDTVARFGGDEFVVLCEDIPTEQEALLLADRLAAVMRRPVDLAGEDTAITMSIGIAFLGADDVSVTSEALVRDAGAAMYQAKEAGRDRHQIFDASIRVAAATRLETIDALRVAVEQDQFRQLLDPRLCEVVEGALVESGLLPDQLHVEVAESALHRDPDASAQALARLRSLGISTGVDDFGTGSSSLSDLKRFPLDVLKIDRTFVEGLGRAREDRAIVASVVDLARALGLTTVAEGVETLEQLDELRGIGCECAQGYLWSRPLVAEEAERWLLAHDELDLAARRVRPGGRGRALA